MVEIRRRRCQVSIEIRREHRFWNGRGSRTWLELISQIFSSLATSFQMGFPI